MAEPSLWKQINYVARFVIDPCDAPFTVYAKFALPALGTALLEWFMIDPKQILLAFVRPGAFAKYLKKGRKGGSHPRGKRTRMPAWQRIFGFDPNEWLGKKIPGAKFFNGRKIGTLEAAFWIGESGFERAAFWYSVIDIGTGFFYNWLSGVAGAGYCDNQNLSIAVAEGGEGGLIGPVPWNPMPVGQVVKQRGSATMGPFGGSCNTRDAYCMAGCTFHNNEATPLTVRFRITGDGGALLALTQAEIPVGGSMELALHAEQPGGGFFAPSANGNTGTTFTGMTFIVSGSGIPIP